MGRFETWLLKVWYGQSPPPLLLRPLSGLYGALVALRRLLYQSGLLSVYRASVPVIVVGNITVGGSGKTPIVEAICRLALARGLTPGIASRGYGRRSTALARVETDSDPVAVGDEPLMLKRRLGVPVAVAARRREAVAALVAQGVDLVVLDDGLQHLAVARDFEVVVIDDSRGLGNGWLLPAGPLRERSTRLQSCDLVLHNGRADEYTLEAAPLRSMQGTRERPLAEFAGREVIAIAGIGHPERFFATLRAEGLRCQTEAFADHHDYTESAIRHWINMTVIATEKDAVKLTNMAGPDWWYLPVAARLGDAPRTVIERWLDSKAAR